MPRALRMESIEVFANRSGGITLKQDSGNDDPIAVSIHPSQAKLLAEWILKVAAEIEARPEDETGA